VRRGHIAATVARGPDRKGRKPENPVGLARSERGFGTDARLGLFIEVGSPSLYEYGLMTLTAVAGAVIGMIPAYRIYRYSLADGMVIRI
jgi:hypothetical protein